MAPQKKGSSTSDIDAIAEDHSDIDAIAESSVPSLDALTTNPKKQGTYRMFSPEHSTSGNFNEGVMIPYENVRSAMQQGYVLHPNNGDARRYANDKFTELKNKGKSPSVDPTKNNDTDLTSQYGVVPTPAIGSKESYQRGGLKVAHGTIDFLPAITAGATDFAVGVPGAATGPGDVALVMGANAAGASAGEVAKQTLNHYIFGENQTPKERAKNVGIQAALGGLTAGGAKLVSIPLAKAATSLGLAADASEKAGFRMLPSEAAGTKAGVFETYPKGSIFTAGKMAKWRELQNQETEKAARKLADGISATSLSSSGSREEAGNAVRKGIEQHMEDFSRSQKVVYGQLEQQAKAAGVQVPRKDVIAAAQKELSRIQRVKAETGGGGPTDEFKNLLKDIVANKKTTASFEAMKDFRTSLLTRARSMNSLMSDPEKSLISNLATVTGDAIEDGLKNSSNPGLATAWRSANNVTREEHQLFLEKLVKNLADKKNPEDIALVLRGNSPSAIAPIGVQETRAAMSVIPKNMIPGVQKQILLDTIYEASGKGAQNFDEGAFAKKILQIGDERGDVLFGGQWPKVREFAHLLNKIRESGGLSGAASLSNPEIFSQIGRMTGEAVLGAVGGHVKGGHEVLAALAPIAGEAALWRTVATALTNPRAAEVVLNSLRRTVRILPYIAAGGYNASKKMRGKVDSAIQKSKEDLIGDANAIGPQSSVATPRELLERAKQLNPAAQGQVAYNHTAVNPATGHRIGSNDGVRWVDLQTGVEVS